MANRKLLLSKKRAYTNVANRKKNQDAILSKGIEIEKLRTKTKHETLQNISPRKDELVPFLFLRISKKTF